MEYSLFFNTPLFDYSIANTTELHDDLKELWTPLNEHILKYNDSFTTPFQELKRHLRIR
jgi:hypothetical protein